MDYIDKNGRGVPTSAEAREFDDIELAELAALTSGGFVVKIEDGRIIRDKAKTKSVKKQKKTKANQVWMSKQ
jgi:hypothetical protein